MSSPSRVMVVALDAADPTLVRELAAAGEMPTMARLLREAAVVDTRAPLGVFVSANWPTIYTANSPDRHGYICWEEIRGGTYEYRETDPKGVQGTPIWQRLSDAGRRVAVLDVPHTVAVPLNGAMLVEWGCHDRHLGVQSWPPELAAELSASHGNHYGGARPPGRDQFAPCDYTFRAGAVRTDAETVELFDAICGGLEGKRRASLDVLDRGGWDFFLTVLGEAHCVGHQLWHLHDPAHERHDPALARRVGGDPVREVYRRLDRVLAEHLERLGPDDTGYVLLPHGMTAHNDGTHLLDHVLHRLDWALDEPHGFDAPTRAAAELSHLLPHRLRRRALRLAAPLLRRRKNPGPPGPLPDLAERRWFLAPNNTVVGAVRLNQAGREPRGQVHPRDRDDILRWLADRLEELVNVDTGGRVVRGCTMTDEVYRRRPGDSLPDLFIEWERSAPIERVWSPAVGTVAVPYEHWRQGDHVREGLLLATGPGIRPGRRRRAIGSVDVGATFAAAGGVQLDDVDGRAQVSLLPEKTRAGIARSSRRERVERVERLARRRAERRVPRWAQRQDQVVARLAEQLDAERQESRHAGATLERLETDVRELHRRADIAAMTAWLAHTEVPERLPISVVMPTRNRRHLLAAAIDSVVAQSYRRWELLVVDDGSTDDTLEFLHGIEDARVHVLSSPARGVAHARNVALEAAHGELVAYLDDDNRFDPQWLGAVASTFIALPQASVCYGARVCDDGGRVLRGENSGRPWLQFEGWDARQMRSYNIADTNVLAHRRSALRYDEALAFFADWDLLLRLAARSEPVEVPAIAAYYRTDVEGRLSTSLPAEEIEREYRLVQRKIAELDGATPAPAPASGGAQAIPL